MCGNVINFFHSSLGQNGHFLSKKVFWKGKGVPKKLLRLPNILVEAILRSYISSRAGFED